MKNKKVIENLESDMQSQRYEIIELHKQNADLEETIVEKINDIFSQSTIILKANRMIEELNKDIKEPKVCTVEETYAPKFDFELPKENYFCHNKKMFKSAEITDKSGAHQSDYFRCKVCDNMIEVVYPTDERTEETKSVWIAQDKKSLVLYGVFSTKEMADKYRVYTRSVVVRELEVI